MTELTGFILERLCEDGELILFRGRRDAGPARVLVAAPALEQPVPEIITRLHHAYSLAAEMDPAWAARPLELVYHEGRPALLMEDPGGDPLERLIGPPMEPPQFLRIAIGIAVALGSLHGRGIIHRNVKPGNILVDSAIGHAWLTGFGIASRLPRERQLPEPPAEIDSGRPFTRSLGGIGCLAMWQWTHSTGSVAVKGRTPVSISYRVTP